MKPIHQLLSLILFVAFSATLYANDTKHLDNTVAAGIVFKLGYLFGSEGTWSNLDTANPQSFQKAMNSISKDISHFSDTAHGKQLKTSGRQLIDFLAKGVRLTSEPYNASKPNAEAEKFLKGLGLDPKKADPADLAKIFSDRISEYAKMSDTPAWVYDPAKREGGARQPATR